MGVKEGTTEEGGTVSFRMTRGAKIVDFTLTKATLYCVTKPSGNVAILIEYTKPFPTITVDRYRCGGSRRNTHRARNSKIGAPV